jgi:hypothetical protein
MQGCLDTLTSGIRAAERGPSRRRSLLAVAGPVLVLLVVLTVMMLNAR